MPDPVVIAALCIFTRLTFTTAYGGSAVVLILQRRKVKHREVN